MTTHGSRNTNARSRSAPKTPQVDQSNLDLDLDQWLAARMLDERKIKVGGKWFRFTGSATADQATKFRETMAADGSVLDMLEVLLVDPGEADELKDSFNNKQRTPLGAERQAEFIAAIINHLLAGVDLGES